MKLSSLINKALSVVAISTIAAFGVCSQAKAVIFSGNSSGLWGKPNPGINYDARYTGVGTSAFTWGLSLPNDSRFGTKANSLTFQGTEFNSNFNSLFKIGDLTYFNGTVPLYTSVEKVPLELQISFQSPTVIKENFNFDFNLINVPNDPNKPINSIDNADYLFIRPSTASRSFKYDGANYTLELTGFSQDGGLTSVPEFRVVEGATTTAEIYGRITYVPPAEKVPEPGIVIGLSSLGVYMLARKNRS
ncbi:hypothetical protein NIES2101_37235 [Calothrix sp. HK-06]|nr:hypothetical protein NIES2101_37235 [Calothrix sp. HK-06]